jgi:HSP20 family molecular chaperone IbpA
MIYYIQSSNGQTQKLDLYNKDSFVLDKMSNEYVSEIEVPGFSKEDLDITVKRDEIGDLVTVKASNAKRKAEASLWIPSAADASLLKASAENGLLTLSVPVKGAYQPKKVKVT